MGRLVRQTVRQQEPRYISSVLSANLTNLQRYDGYRDDLLETLGGFLIVPEFCNLG